MDENQILRIIKNRLSIEIVKEIDYYDSTTIRVELILTWPDGEKELISQSEIYL